MYVLRSPSEKPTYIGISTYARIHTIGISTLKPRIVASAWRVATLLLTPRKREERGGWREKRLKIFQLTPWPVFPIAVYIACLSLFVVAAGTT